MPKNPLKLAPMTHGEYRANVEGMNLFFGADLGVVMAKKEQIGVWDFTATLVVTGSLVISVLYVSTSRSRIIHALFAAVLVAALPRILGPFLTDPAGIPPHLQPTLAVWLAFIVFVEFAPRERPDAAAPVLPRLASERHQHREEAPPV